MNNSTENLNQASHDGIPVTDICCLIVDLKARFKITKAKKCHCESVLDGSRCEGGTTSTDINRPEKISQYLRIRPGGENNRSSRTRTNPIPGGQNLS
jgi:hypothetical protein